MSDDNNIIALDPRRAADPDIIASLEAALEAAKAGTVLGAVVVLELNTGDVDWSINMIKGARRSTMVGGLEMAKLDILK